MAEDTGSSGSGTSKKQTPEDWTSKKGVKGGKGGKYPYYHSWKDRAGNNWGADATQGQESMWFQHRSGTAIEMQHDGSLQITAHNGKYQITFGEDRMTISGAQDITVKGDASLRVYGDYNVTCHKNYNLTVMGDYNFVAKNLNRHIRGNMDTQAKNVNKKVEGSINYQAQGAAMYGSVDSTTVASQGGKTFIAGAKGLHAAVPGEGDMSFYNEKGDMFHQTKDGKSDQSYESGGKKVTVLHKDGKTDHTAEEEITTKSKNKGITTTAKQDYTVKSEQGNIQHKAEQGSISSDAQQNVEIKSQQAFKADVQGQMHLTSQGSAGFEGSETHVGRTAGTTHVVGQSVNVDPSGGTVNLAGGMGMPFSGLNLQMAFNFLTGDQAQGVQDRRSERANQPQEEPDASSWINALDRTA